MRFRETKRLCIHRGERMPGYDDQGQQVGYNQYNQQLAQVDQTNKNYRARLVSWMAEIDDLGIKVEHDVLMGRFDLDLIYQYATVMMGLWRAIRPQFLREEYKKVLDKTEKEAFEYFQEYDGNVRKFVETVEIMGDDGVKKMDYKNMDDLTKLHGVLTLSLVKLDILSATVGYSS